MRQIDEMVATEPSSGVPFDRRCFQGLVSRDTTAGEERESMMTTRFAVGEPKWGERGAGVGSQRAIPCGPLVPVLDLTGDVPPMPTRDSQPSQLPTSTGARALSCSDLKIHDRADPNLAARSDSRDAFGRRGARPPPLFSLQ